MLAPLFVFTLNECRLTSNDEGAAKHLACMVPAQELDPAVYLSACCVIAVAPSERAEGALVDLHL